MFKRILVAERGAAAFRIARSCRRLEIEAVGIARSGALESVHADAFDRVIEINEEELSAEVLVKAIDEAEADAIHFGFSECPLDVVRALHDKGVALLDGPLKSMEILYDRPKRNALVESCGVKIYRPECLDDEDEPERPRLLDILLSFDANGDSVTYGEMEVLAADAGMIAESPAPMLTMKGDGEAIIGAAVDQARRIGKALEWKGMLCLTFALDSGYRLSLQDIHPGLQPRHGAFDFLFCRDLVADSIALAAGENVFFEVDEKHPDGHVIYAQVDAAGEKRQSLDAVHWGSMPHRMGRLEWSVTPDGVLSTDDWPQLVAVFSYAPIRHQALFHLRRFLTSLKFSPIQSNAPALCEILGSELFRSGYYHAESFRDVVVKR